MPLSDQESREIVLEALSEYPHWVKDLQDLVRGDNPILFRLPGALGFKFTNWFAQAGLLTQVKRGKPGEKSLEPNMGGRFIATDDTIRNLILSAEVDENGKVTIPE